VQGADDFRSAKRQREGGEAGKQPGGKRGRGVAFGTGIMDEDDVYGLTDDYVVEAEARDAYHFDLPSDNEDDIVQHRSPFLLVPCTVYPTTFDPTMLLTMKPPAVIYSLLALCTLSCL